MFNIIEDLALMRYFLSLDQDRKRNLRQLALLRPRLDKAEYVKRLVEKGHNREQVIVVYEVLKRYVSFDDFYLYPQDNIRELYLKKEQDFSFLLLRICSKLEIERKDGLVKNFLSKNMEVVTVETILKNFID